MSNKMYTALGPNIFVKEIKKEIKINGMIIPDSLDLDFTFGEVVSCDEGYFDHGNFVPMKVKPGDKVAFAKVSGTNINFNGEKLIRVYAADLIAKESDAYIVNEEN